MAASQAWELSSDPEPHALTDLLAASERTSAALLGIALDRVGIPSRVVDTRKIRLTAHRHVLNGEPTTVRQTRLEDLLAATPVIVVPGF